MSTGFWSAEEYDRRAQERYEAGDYDAALDILQEGTSLYPDAVELRVSLGFTQMGREDFVQARRAFRTALALEDDHEDALAGIGEAHLKLGERARGLAAFERVLDLGFGRDADLMLSIGRALVREDLLDHAERFFRLAVEADEDSGDAAADLAYVVHRQGRRTEARRWFNEALERDPDNHDVRALLAHDLYEAGDRRGALAQYERIPAAAMWDSLTLWRIIELLRACRREPDDGAAVRPYLQRLDELFDASTPEDRLIEEVVSTLGEDVERPGMGQFDLFRPGAESVAGRAEPSGRDWNGVVRLLCRMSSNPDRTVEQFMEDTAHRVQAATGLALPTDDAGAFLEASVRAGVLRLDDWNHGRAP
ncbi:MAG: tetratricopeptide repeat protein [Gemmatimonadales bacterium]|jgi:Flp pilus assembly protein TadD